MNFFDLCKLVLMMLYNLALVGVISYAYYYTKSPWLIFVIVLAVLTHPYFNKKPAELSHGEQNEIQDL